MLFRSPGVGGHCIAVDPWFIVSKNPEESKLIHTARIVNENKPEWVIERIHLKVAEYLQSNTDATAKEVTIACYGLAFKPDIDDLRESPSAEITKALANGHSGKVIAVEPNIEELPHSFEHVPLVSLNTAIQQADIHVLLVDHKEFKEINNKFDFLVDTKGIW